jgi:hypothetical protein
MQHGVMQISIVTSQSAPISSTNKAVNAISDLDGARSSGPLSISVHQADASRFVLLRVL